MRSKDQAIEAKLRTQCVIIQGTKDLIDANTDLARVAAESNGTPIMRTTSDIYGNSPYYSSYTCTAKSVDCAPSGAVYGDKFQINALHILNRRPDLSRQC